MEGKAVSPLFGDVVLDKRGIDDSFRYGIGRKKAIAYAAVKDVIEKGVLIDSHINHKDRGYNTSVLSAPISINGERFICYAVIRMNEKENRFYLHEVITQKSLEEKGLITSQNQSQSQQGIAKILKNIINAKSSTTFELFVWRSEINRLSLLSV